MIKHYVGARYVPKFASPVEWAADTSYEALTIVTFNNASYTSKIQVPPTVGNPANNPQYWALTGNYNAQVEQYRQETETVSNNLTTEITNRKNADSALQDQISAKATSLQTQISEERTERSQQDAVLSARMNEFTKLPDGSLSTAADAELVDIRVKADGNTASTAGNAVREQITELKNDLYTSFPITPTTETNRYIGQTLNIGAWEKGSIAYFPITEDRFKNRKFTMKSTSPINYMAIGFSNVFPSYGITLTNGYYVKTSRSELSAKSQESSLFVVIAYETADQSKISLYVDFSDSELNSDRISVVQDQIDATNDTIDSIVTSEINLLEDATMYGGYHYPHYNTTKEANTACNCFSPIPVRAGQTYYFRRIWSNFSFIKLSDGNYVSFNSSTSVVNGSYTPSKDGEAYITVESVRDASSALLTTSEPMYDTEHYSTKFVPNKLAVPKTYYVKKDGSGDFTKLSDAIIEATKYMDSIVFVGPGTWDLIDELGSEYIESVGINNRGLYLKNRVHLIFASNSKVTCNYTGTTASVRAWLSAFNAGEYGFTLENCRLEASNCRYAIHDERDADTDQYTNIYKNCSMYMNNSTNTETTAHQCIGGGLGVNGHIVIENCDFESVNTRAVPSSAYTPVSYHNSAGSGKNRIDASGVYMINGTFRLNWYGASTEKTKCYVHDCSLTHSIINDAETSGSTNENMEVIAWNNEIRS